MMNEQDKKKKSVKLRDCMKEIDNLLKAKIGCIWVKTFEEEEFLKELKILLLNYPGLKLKQWSETSGLIDIPLIDLEQASKRDPRINLQMLFKNIEIAQNKSAKEESIWVINDLHFLTMSGNRNCIRALRDVKEYRSKNYNPIIIVSPIVSIPLEWEKLFTIVDFELLQENEIKAIINIAIRKLRNSGNKNIPSKSEEIAIVNACKGLTRKEIIDVLKKSKVKYGTLDLKSIIDQKIQLIKKNDVLEYKIPKISLDDIGGNDAFKKWYGETKYLFSDKAKEFGCKKPKGFLSLGVPGSGKTALAEAIASDLKTPFIKLAIGRCMAKQVGESEKRILEALKICKACAPCVVLLDEIEKALGGMISSNSSEM